MGLIRKALSVSTLGGVKYTSRREAETKSHLANARLVQAQTRRDAADAGAARWEPIAEAIEAGEATWEDLPPGPEDGHASEVHHPVPGCHAPPGSHPRAAPGHRERRPQWLEARATSRRSATTRPGWPTSAAHRHQIPRCGHGTASSTRRRHPSPRGTGRRSRSLLILGSSTTREPGPGPGKSGLMPSASSATRARARTLTTCSASTTPGNSEPNRRGTARVQGAPDGYTHAIGRT